VAKFGLETGSGGTAANVEFHPENLLRFLTVLARFLSFASFEMARFLGADTTARLGFFGRNPWLIPFAALAGLVGILQPIALLILGSRSRASRPDWNAVRLLALLTFLAVYLSFAFSVKKPASHTFYLVLPVAMIYSFSAWSSFFRIKLVRVFTAVLLLCGIIFHTGLAIDRLPRQSLYKDRNLVLRAIQEKNFHILGERRDAIY
jgi:hypothetical protein